jgi:hypothetical protein
MSRNKQPFWKQKPQNVAPQAQPQTPPPNAPSYAPVAGKPPLKVLVAIFTGEERHGWVNPRLATTLLKIAFDRRIAMSFVPVHAVHPICAARNMAVSEYFLKSDCDMLVIFDNDVCPPDNVVDAFISMPDEANVGVLPYWVWLPDKKHTMPCFGHWEDGVMIIPDPTTIKRGWQKMGAGGTGCMFIRRKVFTSPDKLAAPFFKIISTAEKGQVVSEDIYFTGRAAEAGFPTWLNPDFICSHMHTVDLAEINMGTVMILNRFTETLKAKYGENGVKLGTLIQELAPELKESAEKLRIISDAAYDSVAQSEKEGAERQEISRKAIKEG